MAKKEDEKKAAGGSVAEKKPTGVAGLPMIVDMAKAHGVDPQNFVKTIMNTAFKGDKQPTGEEFTALMMVAKEYDLDPFMNQIYAFPSKGGIIPFLGIDGWIDLINRQPKHDGLEVVEEETEDGKPHKTTCRISVKGYDNPVSISERFSECYRDTGPWNSHPFRMLRHKAIIQCGRVAYGLSGLYDQDEAERILEARGETIDVTPPSAAAGQVAPLPLDVGKVVEPESDVEIDEPEREETAPQEPQDDTAQDDGSEAPEGTEVPAEASTGPENGNSEATGQEDLNLEPPPESEQGKVLSKIYDLAAAMDMDGQKLEKELAAAKKRGLEGLEALRQKLYKEYNAGKAK